MAAVKDLAISPDAEKYCHNFLIFGFINVFFKCNDVALKCTQNKCSVFGLEANANF